MARDVCVGVVRKGCTCRGCVQGLCARVVHCDWLLSLANQFSNLKLYKWNLVS